MQRRLGLLLQRLQNVYSRNLDHYAKSIGLTGTQMLIIEYLASFRQKKPLYQKDVEHEFNIRKSTATNILNLMVQKGLIVRMTSSVDARLKELELTQKAEQLDEQVTQYFIASEQKTEQILGKQAKQELMADLVKLEQALNK
ncbi:MarR family winged helix-turn-helix transcriptional regulator [Lactobacillus sp. ESL0681]|uniref:MarR family winged helix-turn-helix transcriptional regulator n=1 Tax=Lactobacillus sp. ESL0681 TaxID=2983211 RepID=UPI0023F8E8CA|nr:MarR family winged helix-turn-helix transcriptional regulator [Lactobacillus sp. ESL0681]WEV40485.1 MarR family winged helix-turn-helix transcriptional regulator [Lactobacillus sp. ESL0681]